MSTNINVIETEQKADSTPKIQDVERLGSSQNHDGTFHQSKLGPKATRKHFFSPLDLHYANAVHQDAETVTFTEDEDVRVFNRFG